MSSAGTMLRLAVDVILVVVAGSVVFNAVVSARAARARRRDRAVCMHDDEPVPWPARTLAWLGTFAAECIATAVLAVTAPLACLGPRVRRIEGTDCRPVLLVSGWLQHPVTFLWLAHRLRRDGWRPVQRVLPLWGDIQHRAAVLGRAVERIRREAGVGAVDIVAHGRGGLVARACLRAAGGASGVARLITLGSPHQGTEALPGGALRPGSALLADLAADDPVPRLVEAIAIYSRDDAIVAPGTRAYYPGAFNIEVGGVGHFALLLSGRIYALVRENLAAEPAEAAAPGAARG